MLRPIAVALAVFTTSAALFPALASQDELTIIYLEPNKPQSHSMFMVAEWPSFRFLPNAPVMVQYVDARGRPIAGSVSFRSSFSDLDCDQVSVPVDVRGGDPHGLDGDGDGIGCE